MSVQNKVTGLFGICSVIHLSKTKVETITLMFSVYTNGKTEGGDDDPLFSVYSLHSLSIEQNSGKLKISVKVPPFSLLDLVSLGIFKYSVNIWTSSIFAPPPLPSPLPPFPSCSVDPQLTPD